MASAALAPRQASVLRLDVLLGRRAEVIGNSEQSRWVGQLLGWEAAEQHRHSLEKRLRDAASARWLPVKLSFPTLAGPSPANAICSNVESKRSHGRLKFEVRHQLTLEAGALRPRAVPA